MGHSVDHWFDLLPDRGEQSASVKSACRYLAKIRELQNEIEWLKVKFYEADADAFLDCSRENDGDAWGWEAVAEAQEAWDGPSWYLPEHADDPEFLPAYECQECGALLRPGVHHECCDLCGGDIRPCMVPSDAFFDE